MAGQETALKHSDDFFLSARELYLFDGPESIAVCGTWKCGIEVDGRVVDGLHRLVDGRHFQALCAGILQGFGVGIKGAVKRGEQPKKKKKKTETSTTPWNCGTLASARLE